MARLGLGALKLLRELLELPPEFTFGIEVSSVPNRLVFALTPLSLIVTFPKGATVSGLVSVSLAIFRQLVGWLVGSCFYLICIDEKSFVASSGETTA